MLVRAFLPTKKAGNTVIATSSGFAFLPPGYPFMAKSSAYSTSKMGTARFYEFLATENPDLNMFILQPGVIRTAVYNKGKLELDSTMDTGKPILLEQQTLIPGADGFAVQLPAHFSVWLASSEARSLPGRFFLPIGTWISCSRQWYHAWRTAPCT